MSRPAAVLEVDLALLAIGKSVCSRCERLQDASEFPREKRSKTGIKGYCITCNRAYFAAHARKYRSKRDVLLKASTPEFKKRARDHRMRRKFGLTAHEVDVMLAEQDGRCAICMTPKPERAWHVDHDHETGAVRGVLCGTCNLAVGYLADDPERMRAAALYIEASKRLPARWSSK